MALLRARDYALPQDVAALAYDVLRHRIILNYQAIVDGVLPEHVVQRALQAVPVPQIDLRTRGRVDRAAKPSPPAPTQEAVTFPPPASRPDAAASA